MKNKHYLFASLLFLFTFFGNSQQNQSTGDSNAAWTKMMQDPSANFYDVQQAFNSYWSGRSIERGKGYKVFKRWEAYMKPRVYPTGEMTQVSQSYTNFKNWERDNPDLVDKSTTGTWQLIGPTGAPTSGGAGRLNFVRFDPTNSNTLYVGAPDGGLWKSTNGGSSWTVMTDQLTVIGCTDVVIDPTNTQIMYLATGDGEAGDTYSVGILKSTDGGTTWNTTGLNWSVSLGRRISKVIMDPTNSSILLAATSNGIYRTTNGGTTWTQEDTRGMMDIEFKPSDPNTVYAAGDEFVKSTDNGASWTTITSGLPSSTGIQRIAIAVSEANTSYVYLLIGKYSDQGLYGIYRSTNSGTSFTQRHSGSPNLLGWQSDGSDSGGQAFYDLTIAASPTNAEMVLVGGVNLWRSTNGGTSFSINGHWYGDIAPYIHADQHDIVFAPGSSTYYAANDGGLFRTTNNGSTWTDLSSNLAIAQQYRISLSTSNANLLVSGHQDNGTNKYNGTSWSEIYGGDGMDCFIDRTNNNTIIASYVYGEHHKSTNGGSSWSDITTGLPVGQGSAEWLSVLHQDPVTANTYYAGGRSQLYRSTNGGSSWSALGTPSGSGNIVEFAIAPSNNQTIYAIKDNAVSKSTNGGSSWTSISTGLPVASVSPTNVAISDTDPNVLFVTFSGYSAANKVFKSTNGGSTWTNISTGLPNVPCNTIVFHNGSSDQSTYVGTDVGVYYKDNTMASWTMFSNGLPRTAVSDLEIYYATGRLRAGTFGRGTWDSDLYTSSVAPVADFSASSTNLLVGQSTNFTDLSTGSPTSYSWSFSGGTPSTSTIANPTVTYNTAGTFNVSLTVSNANGSDTETKTAYIIVSNPPPPVADFTANPTVGTPGQTIAFTNASTGNPTSYSWTFTGGTPSSSTAVNPSIVYNTPGVYTVSLTATNSGGSDTKTRTNYITINAPVLPVADFVSSHSSICPGQGIQFTSTSTGNPTSYSWSFPGAVTPSSTLQNPIVYYSTAGTYSVSLTVVNTDGSDSETKTAFVTVGNPTGESIPYTEGFEANFANYKYVSEVSSATQIWNFSALNFGNAPTPDYSYTADNFNNDTRGNRDGFWMPGIDLSTVSNATLTFDVAYARYDATFSDTLEIMVSTDCGSSFNNLIYYKGGSDLATAADMNTAFAPTASDWAQETVDLTPFTGNENVIIRFMDVGGYGNFLYLDNINISGQALNPPVASFTANTNAICAGNSISFTSTSTNNPTSYSWSFPGGTPSTSTLSNPMVTYSTAGTYDVSLTATNADGSDTQVSTNFITINASPTPTITAGSSTVLCPGENVVLTSSYASGNTWSNAMTTQSVTISSPGNYFVTVLDNNSCSGVSNIISVTSQNSPGISLGTVNDPSTCGTSSGSIQITGSGTGDLSWSGTSSGSLIAVALPTTIPNLAAGSYSIVFTDGCVSNTINATLNDPSGIIPTITLDGPATICEGQSVTLSSSASSGNSWSTGATSQTITVTSTGTFSVTTTDGNNCSASSSPVIITVNPVPSITLGTVINPGSCNSSTGSILINGNGTGNLTWSGSDSGNMNNVNLPATIPNLGAGSYSLNFNNGCSSNTITADLVDPTPTVPVITANGPTTFCQGGSVLLSSSIASGNSWSTGATSQNITVNSSGTFTVSTTDANNCTASSTAITITVEPSPVIALGNITNPAQCSSATGSIEITGTGSGTLTWSGANTGSSNVTLPFTIQNLMSGSYTISFSGTCNSNTLTTTLIDPNSPTAPVISANGSTTFCSGDNVILTSSISTGISWSTGATSSSISVSTSGTYFVTLTENGCTATSNLISISVNPVATITLGSTTNPSTCGAATGSITVNGSGTGSVAWNGEVNGNSATISLPYVITDLPAGSYSIIFTNGCLSNTLTCSLSDPGAPTPAIITANGSTDLCVGETVVLTSNVATGNLWSNGSTAQSISVNSSGVYSVTLTSGNCSSTSNTILVNVNPNPSTPSITVNGNTLLCEGESVTLTSSSLTGNLWSTNEAQQSITVTESGNYSVSVTQNGCTSATSTTVNVTVNQLPPTPTITLSNGNTICEGESVTLTSSSANSNTWSTNETSQNITVTQPGTYTVTVTQTNCSSSSAPVTIIVNPLPTVTLSDMTDVCDFDSPILLSQGLPTGGNYSGSGVSGNTFDPSAANLGSNIITYSFTDANSCTNTAQTTVVVNHCSSVGQLSGSSYKIYPNPAKHIIFVEGKNISSVKLLDFSGKVILHQEGNNEQYQLLIPSISQGIYYIELIDNGTKRNEKIEIFE